MFVNNANRAQRNLCLVGSIYSKSKIRRVCEMSLLRPTMKILIPGGAKNTPIVQEKASKEEKGGNKLPPDTYKKIIEGMELKCTDHMKLCFSVSRKGDDGLPHVDIREFAMTEVYTGMTKKGINFNIEYLDEIIGILQAISMQCESKGL